MNLLVYLLSCTFRFFNMDIRDVFVVRHYYNRPIICLHITRELSMYKVQISVTLMSSYKG